MDVLIFSGQSNMQGQTECRPVTQPVSGAFEYLHQFGILVPLNHPVGETLGHDDSHFSHVLLNQSAYKNGSLVPAFCREYVKERGEVLAIHAALGATVIADWLPDTARYSLMTEKIKAGIRAAAAGHTVGRIYFIWLQGESDALAQTTAEAYLERLTCLKDALKCDVGIDRFGIIRVGRFSSLVGPGKSELHEQCLACDHAIMDAQERAVSKDKDFIMLTRLAEELSCDAEYVNPGVAGHFNNKGMDLLGQSAARGLLQQTKDGAATDKTDPNS